MLLVGAGLGIYYKTDLFRKPPPPTPKAMGELHIASNPEGAQIFLDNADTRQVTPTTLKNLEVGESHTVVLKKPKFKEWTKTFTLADPNPVTFNPTLEVIPVGSIKIATQPPGAKIHLNGQDTQKTTPATLEELPLSQTYTLRLELDKHRPVEEKITVYSIEPIDFTKKLEEILYGSVRVASNPTGARIYLNNSDTGVNTPASLSNLEVGKSYNIRLAKAGFRDAFRSIQLTDTRALAFTEQLKKIEEKTPEQLAQERLKEQQRQQELEKQKQAELEKQKEKSPEKEKASEAERQKQAELEKQREAERQKQAELQKQKEKEKQKEAEKEKEQEKVGGDSYVALSTDPKGASVYINGVQRGSAPGKWKVAAGSPVEVKVSGDGCAPVTKVVTLRPGETRNLGTIKCGGTTTGGPSVVLVDSNPPGAMVFLNGAPQKATPLRIRGLRLSTTHTITVKKDGYETWSRSFTVEEGNQSFVANLKKL
jgi:flagellar motor protein MotB